MNTDREPLEPPPAGVTVSENQYQITYRDNDTGEEFTVLSPRDLWLEKVNGLHKAGFDVVVQQRQVTTTAWKVKAVRVAGEQAA
jgi:hypothetical protein